MIPLADNNPTGSFPLFTIALIAACIGVYLLQMGAPDGFVRQFGFIPAATVGGQYLPENIGWPGIVSSMFMHGSIAHIGGNMLYLWVFGDNLEHDLGRVRFLVFYGLCGLVAALTQAVPDPASTIPMVGASGAISGLLGGYLVLHPKQSITTLVPNAGVVQMPAIVVIGLWFAFQLISGLMTPAGSGGVAFWAHIGGFVAGVVLVRLMKPRGGGGGPRVVYRADGKPRLWG